MPSNVFVDPRTGSSYTWPRNHNADGAGERGIARNVDVSASTGGTALVRQQGADSPMDLSYQGVIVDPTHHDRMVAWARHGGTQTIYFTEAYGGQYEVMVTGFRSAPVAVGANGSGGTIAPNHVWNYQLDMHVVEVLSGTWTSTTLT